MLLDYRGADNVVTNTQQLTHAECVDLYGDPISTRIIAECTPNSEPSGKSSWTRNVNEINGKRFLQIRFTMVNNLATGAVPNLSTLGIGWLRQT